MNTALAQADHGALIESVIVRGDLSKLSPEERTHYYVKVCESVKLNPLTKPFEYIVLNGKLTLYARRDATDQLRSIHNVSVTDMTEAERDGVFVVTAKVCNAEGRTDIAKGAVNISGLKGDALANALMKAETKAKRRATLSICGLGFLDETEIETIPNAEAANGNGKRTRQQITDEANRKRQELRDCENDINQIETLYALEKYEKEVLTPDFMASLGMKQYALAEVLEKRRDELAKAEGNKAAEIVGEMAADKAAFIQHCHDIIEEAKDAKALIDWWNAGKKERIAIGLTVEENQALMTRVFERRERIVAPRDVKLMSPLEAG